MNIVVITDAWKPQVNGVVRTLDQMHSALAQLGHQLRIVGPARRVTVPCPSYPEIRLSLGARRIVRKALKRRDYDAVHIATEGPLGIAARGYCRRHGIEFTTACHTRLAEYLEMRLPLLSAERAYRWLRRFHGAAAATLVRSHSHEQSLKRHGFTGLQVWPGAVDTARFRPMGKDYWHLPRPISLYAGRVAMEKNLPAFLDLELPGSKVVLGDGPDRKRLQKRYPDVLFAGYHHGDELTAAISAADVFVFPSATDTLGLVMLEAMACGVPVAAFPVPGPQDVVRDGVTGALDHDLRAAVFRALRCAPEDCIEHAAGFSIRQCAERFLMLVSQPVQRPPAETGHSTYNPDAWPAALTQPAATAAISTPPAN